MVIDCARCRLYSYFVVLFIYYYILRHLKANYILSIFKIHLAVNIRLKNIRKNSNVPLCSLLSNETISLQKIFDLLLIYKRSKIRIMHNTIVEMQQPIIYPGKKANKSYIYSPVIKVVPKVHSVEF